MWVLINLCFMFSSFYRLGPHNETCVPLANLWQSTTKIIVKIEPRLIYLCLSEVHAC